MDKQYESRLDVEFQAAYKKLRVLNWNLLQIIEAFFDFVLTHDYPHKLTDKNHAQLFDTWAYDQYKSHGALVQDMAEGMALISMIEFINNLYKDSPDDHHPSRDIQGDNAFSNLNGKLMEVVAKDMTKPTEKCSAFHRWVTSPLLQ